MNPNLSRRRFLESSATLLGVALVGCSEKTAAPQSRVNSDGTVSLSGVGEVAPGAAVAFTFPNGESGLVFRTLDGQSGAVSSKCTHAGCTVEWNATDEKIPLRCPCHNSNFALDGRVLGGPAKTPLAHYSATTQGEEFVLKRL
ncbi:MAG TPA: ubiquinol-cytochrome c reductase iron-sulfur subunit [Abditibacterium sp.]|jgi:cytochrome b6-f complex iron-sulfur subunit